MNAADMLKRRESHMGCKGAFSQAQCCHLASFHYLPSRATRVIDRMQSRVYIGNFSAEGNVFVGKSLDFKFARTLLSCLGVKPVDLLCCHHHSGGQLQKPPQHFPAMHCVGVLAESFMAAGQLVPGSCTRPRLAKLRP